MSLNAEKTRRLLELLRKPKRSMENATASTAQPSTSTPMPTNDPMQSFDVTEADFGGAPNLDAYQQHIANSQTPRQELPGIVNAAVHGGAGAMGAVDALMLGLPARVDPETFQYAQQEFPISSLVGEIAGSIAPISAAGTVARSIPALAKLGGKGAPAIMRLLGIGAREGTAGTMYGGARAAASGGMPQDALTEGALWAGLGTGLGAAGRGGSALIKGIRKARASRSAAKAERKAAELFDKEWEAIAKSKIEPKIRPSNEVPFARDTRSGATILNEVSPEPFFVPSGKRAAKRHSALLAEDQKLREELVQLHGKPAAPQIAVLTRAELHAAVKTGSLDRGALQSHLGMKMKPIEAHSGVNPFGLLRKGLQKMFGAEGKVGGRRLVNIAGTPEITLRGRGIVDPFINAEEKILTAKDKLRPLLDDLLQGVKKRSDDDLTLFDRLDNPSAVLSGKDAQLRKLLDNTRIELNQHLKARREDAIPYRKGYITHLVDKVGEMFPNIDKLREVGFRFSRRLGGQEYKHSAVEAIDAYMSAALRSIHVGDALHAAAPNVEKLTMGTIGKKVIITTKDGKKLYNFNQSPAMTEAGYAEAYIRAQLGVGTQGQNIVHAITRITPRTQEKVLQGITNMFYKALLGGAIDTSLKNATQGIHTMADLGVIPSLKGYGKFASQIASKAGREEYAGLHLIKEFEPLIRSGEALKFKSWLGKIDKYVLSSPMTFAEHLNRGTGFHAYLDSYLKKGVPIEQAYEMAKKGVRGTQFAYGRIHISPYMRGYMRLPYQFMSFPTKTAEMLYQMAIKPGGNAKLLRYFAVTGGLISLGAAASIDLSNVFLNPFKFVDPDSREGIKVPWTDKRIALSLEKALTSGPVPQGLAPTFTIPPKLVKQIKDGDDRWLKTAGTGLVPGGRYGYKVGEVIHGITTEEAPTGYRGRKTYEPSTSDHILKLAGLRSTDVEIKRNRMDRTNEIIDDYYQKRRDLVDALLARDTGEAQDIVNEVEEKYPYLLEKLFRSINSKVLKEEMLKKNMTSEQRFYMSNKLRGEVAGHL